MKQMAIKVGARESPLSKAQVLEVIEELRRYVPHLDFQLINTQVNSKVGNLTRRHVEFKPGLPSSKQLNLNELSDAEGVKFIDCRRSQKPTIEFTCVYIKTSGDKDLTTSLRSLNKTNFFTKELDEMLLKGECRIAIHSAKDLPDPIPEGLKIIALTKGVDSADALVLRSNTTLASLPPGALIATSSERREEMVKRLRADLRFCDIRGTIDQRLKKLEQKEVDGVVIAEAALIRLGLTHLNRLRLPGETTPLQGQLAILSQSGDLFMRQLFAPLDVRMEKKQRLLYLGLNSPPNWTNHEIIHYPLITIEPRPLDEIKEAFHHFEQYTHIILTSRTAVDLFFITLQQLGLSHAKKCFLAVGRKTAEEIARHGINDISIAEEETAEGVVEMLRSSDLQNAFLFWPHSALSRPTIREFCQSMSIPYQECLLYDTRTNRSLSPIDLKEIDEIIFTSPSTVTAFVDIFDSLPKDIELTPIGPVTKNALKLHS